MSGDPVADEHAYKEAVDERDEPTHRREDRQALIAGQILNREENVRCKKGAHEDVHDAVDPTTVPSGTFHTLPLSCRHAATSTLRKAFPLFASSFL